MMARGDGGERVGEENLDAVGVFVTRFMMSPESRRSVPAVPEVQAGRRSSCTPQHRQSSGRPRSVRRTARGSRHRP